MKSRAISFDGHARRWAVKENMMKPYMTLVASVLLLTTGCATTLREKPPWQGFRSRKAYLLSRLSDQTGTTEGYGHEFTIHEHDPAKSLIEMGPDCVPDLMRYLNDMQPTKAWWFGRSSRYNLRVSDVVVCILRKIGSEKEVKSLRRRLKMYDEVTEHVDEFTTYHETLSFNDLRWYPDLMRPARSGQSILMWAIRDIEERIKERKAKAQPAAPVDRGQAPPTEP